VADNQIGIDVDVDLSRVRAALARISGISGAEAREFARQLAADVRAANAMAEAERQPTVEMGVEVRREAVRADGVVGLVATVSIDLVERAPPVSEV